MKHLIILTLSALCLNSHATIVEIVTNKGTIEVNLFDNTTEDTVDNFLYYVNSGSYTDSIVHRSVPGFIIQSGGYNYDGTSTLQSIPTVDPVLNEPEYSNLRGTIAMAKVSGNQNSATSQWFINLEDNSEALDPQNGGFTVFGQITSGMEVVDAIAALPTFNFQGALSELPLDNYTEDDYNGDPDNDIDPTTPDSSNLVLIYAINVTDASEDTADGLSPTENTLIDSVEVPDNNNGYESSGSIGISGFLLGLLLLSRRRRV
ncbi:MAG: peptidylprolyl isomerase [Gammaproteobacteria bacterium]|nr:peptidylprolyl isomerase [Gammaproteobacteria bacterium]